MSVNLWEIDFAVKDAVEILERASRLACEASGYSGGQQADPEYGVPEVPAVEGWPAMNTLCDELQRLADLVKAVIAPEIREAIQAERDENDQYDEPEAIGLRP